ncbi:MAG: CotH kinase family protein [Prevotella sp.]|nr:CotH kinase family protein [Prevotella sp.]
MNKAVVSGLFLLGWLTANAQVVINELMQSNVDCIMDDLNEFPDSWVELYNTGKEAVNLKDWRLGISENADEAWQLQDMKIGPKQCVLVYCDKEGKKMHTPFRLESGKDCEVYLFKGTEVIDKVTGLQKQPAPNIAYGRQTDGSSEWGYQLKATPGFTNCGRTTDKLLGNPVFSKAGCVLSSGSSFSLVLSLPEDAPEDAVIRMTTDGSEPTENSQAYSKPISISTTKIIRARIFCDGWLSPRSVAHSYIFFPREQTLPIVSIMTDKRYLEDSKIGIYVDGNYKTGKKNYEFNWRRPMNIEIFETSGEESVINQLGEARIMGGATRSAALKSLAFYAHKRFGKKHFNYEFFPDQKPGLTEFKSILLRNAGNDFDYLYMRDAIIQRSMAAHADLDWQAWRPVIIYINGTYRGMLNIRERSNDDYVWTNYQKLEDIDMIENWGELKEGDDDHYDAFTAFYNEHGHTLAEYEQWMDWEEFINLMVMNLYFNNQDFPGNNLVMWRPRTEDGRWRWIAKDTDFGLGLYGSSADYKTIEWLYNPDFDWNRNWANGSKHTRLFRSLMEDADFNREFIDRSCIYMGDFLNEEGVRKIWDPMYDLIKTEYPNHRKLINQWWPNYDEELSSARRWLSERTNQFYKQLGSYYQLGAPIVLTINQAVNEAQKMSLHFNGIPLSQGTFNGKFFAGRTVTLEGHAPEGKVVVGWDLVTKSSSGIESRQIDGERCSFVMPTCASIAVNAILGDASAINSIEESQWTWQRDGESLILSNVPAGTKIQLYDLRGILLHSVVSDGSELILPVSRSNLHILKVGIKTVKF